MQRFAGVTNAHFFQKIEITLFDILFKKPASRNYIKGKEFEEGKLTLADLRNYAAEIGEPATKSGKQYI